MEIMRSISSRVCALAVLTALSSPTIANPTWPHSSSTSGLSNGDTSLTLLYQNNLNASDDVNHISAILLDPVPAFQASAACTKLSEQLLSRSALETHENDFYHQLTYLTYDGRAVPGQQYIISGGTVAANAQAQCLDFSPLPQRHARLPVLCSQSSNASQPTNSVAHPTNEITVGAGGNRYVGYRNLKSWRFSGIPYADQPQRWHPSSLYSGEGQTLNATVFGSECPQNGAGSETCQSTHLHGRELCC